MKFVPLLTYWLIKMFVKLYEADRKKCHQENFKHFEKKRVHIKTKIVGESIFHCRLVKLDWETLSLSILVQHQLQIL